MIAEPLLAWYDREGRNLPWRLKGGGRADPYRVWLSEIMLQQTTVKSVIPYFERFVTRWPDAASLAAANLDDILAAWAGLGYYARARNMKKCAETVVRDHGGAFPASEAELRKLPGIGIYTAAAIAAIAFDIPAAVADGNVERVLSRLFALETPLPEARTEIRALAAKLTPDERPGDYAQAMMDLGATVCTPKGPCCGRCPIKSACQAESPERYPRKSAKAPRPVRHAVAFVVFDGDHVLLQKRPDHGLLGGMMGVPCSPFAEAETDRACAPPFSGPWQETPGHVVHIFTHFELRLRVRMAAIPAARRKIEGHWQPLEALAGAAVPTLFRKAIAHACGVRAA